MEEPDAYVCEICNKTFSSKKSLQNHKKKHKVGFKCKLCSKIFTSKFSCMRHLRQQHGEVKTDTSSQLTSAARDAESGPTAADGHSALPSSSANTRVHNTEHQVAMRGLMEKHILEPLPGERADLILCFRGLRPLIRNILRDNLSHHRGIKWNMVMKIEMVKERSDGSLQQQTAYFRSSMSILLCRSNIMHEINQALQKLYNSFEEYNNKGSGWRIHNICQMEVIAAAYKPLGGSSYIPVPKKLRSTKGIINVKNHDNMCFKWAVLSALHPASASADRQSTYEKYAHELDFSSVKFPVKINHIDKFEKNNDISICVFAYEKGEIFPRYISKQQNAGHQVDLLFLQRGNKSHYCWIKNLDRTLRHTKGESKHKYFFCRYCMHGFTKESNLIEHLTYCSKNAPQKIQMPEPGTVLKFDKFENQYKVPFVVYCDMECYCVPNEGEPNKSIEYVPCSFGYQLVCVDPKYSKPPKIYRGSKASEKFLEAFFKEEIYISNILSNKLPLNMSAEDEHQFQEATHCHICEQEFEEEDIKVRDHDHLTSKFRGAAHRLCNLEFKPPRFIPVIFHNLKGFDGKLICQAIGKFKSKKIECIASTLENYISFSLGNFRFIDSFQFLSCSLEQLVSNLAKEGDIHFHYLKRAFPHKWQTDLLLRKGVYPYEYVKSEAAFEDTSLPPKSAFYSCLKQEHISDDDYRHAQIVWQSFNLQNLGQYHDIYLLADVLQLASVFERFREVCLADTRLDPAQHFTTPHLSWQSMLKMTGVELELLHDPNMYMFFEQSIRGGVAASFKRLCVANNRYMEESFDPEQPEKYIIYLDMNNLYGLSMSQPLPLGEFRWLSREEIEALRLQDIPTDGPLGYMFEVDLSYGHHLHDYHRSYPLGPEKRTITYEDLSPYSKDLWNKHNESKNKSSFKTTKLVLTLEDKHNYLTHYRCLQFYVKHGLRIKKIHRVLEFVQQPWMQPYISFNTEKRKAAKNDFESDFYKLKNNSTFGKCMENLRNRTNVKLVNSPEKFQKLVAKPSLERIRIFNKDLVGLQHKKVKLTLNRPVYVGATILELAKLAMYQFHYDFMKPKFGASVDLLYTDTDSLVYEVTTPDLYRELERDKHLFDFSNYPKDHFAFDDSRKKQLGLMKDEMASKPITQWISLKSKMYSFLTDNKQVNKAKGVSKSVVKKSVSHGDYLTCLKDQTSKTCEMRRIGGERHKLYMYTLQKKSLNCYDDKVWLCDDGITSYPYGHYATQRK